MYYENWLALSYKLSMFRYYEERRQIIMQERERRRFEEEHIMNYYALLAAILSPVKLNDKGDPIVKHSKEYNVNSNNTKRKKNQYLLNLGKGEWKEFETYDKLEFEYVINSADDAFRALGETSPSCRAEKSA